MLVHRPLRSAHCNPTYVPDLIAPRARRRPAPGTDTTSTTAVYKMGEAAVYEAITEALEERAQAGRGYLKGGSAGGCCIRK